MDNITNSGLSKWLGLDKMPTHSYEFGGKAYSTQELWCKISEKMNIIIEHFNYLNNTVKDEQKLNQEKFDYLLGEGLSEAVIRNLMTKIEDGTISEILNVELLGNINEAIENITEIDVKLFGAVGDGITDDTLAINNAISFINALTPNRDTLTILFPSAKGYLVSNTISIPKNVNIIMKSPLIYDGIEGKECLVIGESGTINNCISMQLMVERKNISSWTNENDIGIKIINAYGCDINLKYANKFTIGVQLMGSAHGVAYNNIVIGRLLNNHIGLDLTNEVYGWCNENNFVGGGIQCHTGMNTGLSRYGVRITSKDLTYKNNNNNVFIKTSFELGKSMASPNEALPILIEYGQNNIFKHVRDEQNSDLGLMRCLNNSNTNTVEVGYMDSIRYEIDEQSVYKSSNIMLRSYPYRQHYREVFKVENVHKSTVYYNDTALNVADVHGVTSGDGKIYKVIAGNIADTYLEISGSYGIGRYISTNLAKRFAVFYDIDQNYGGRIAIRCFSNDGTLLTHSTDKRYIFGAYESGNPTWSSYYGGAYMRQVDNDNGAMFVFSVSDEVAYIQIILTGGAKPIRLRSFSVNTFDNYDCASWTGLEEIPKGCNVATKIPTKGTYGVGKIIYNATPTNGSYVGWIQVSSGVWKGFGLIES